MPQWDLCQGAGARSLSPRSIPRSTSGFLELPVQAFCQASTLLQGALWCTSCLVGPDTQNARHLLSATPNPLGYNTAVQSLKYSCVCTYKLLHKVESVSSAIFKPERFPESFPPERSIQFHLGMKVLSTHPLWVRLSFI